MKAIYIDQPGGPEAMKFGEVETPVPAAGQVLVKLEASGVNFIDTYHRSGLYKIPLPGVLGMEGAGTVEALGDGVASDGPNGFKIGDRVAWAMARGSYAEYAAVPAQVLVHVPHGVDLRDAAATMLQGMTAHYLTHSTFHLQAGHTCLVHAAAGGTGRLICQIAKLIGAKVIGTAGSPEKADVAKGAGADHVILYKSEDFLSEVKRLTDGKGVEVVYDGVGAATFAKSLDCLRPRGMMVIFGNASGPVAPVDPLSLSSKGSLFLTRPTLANYSSPEELAWRAGDLFQWITEGKVKLMVEHLYPLADAAKAHTDLEGRATMGKLILTV
jgi:NADPH2:quinone reductase